MSPSTKCSVLTWLTDGQQGVGLVRALADADGHVAVRLEAQHRAGENLVLLRGEALEDHAALGLADALNDDLLGRLGGDAAEGLRLDLHVHEIAELCVRVDLARGVERDLGGGGDGPRRRPPSCAYMRMASSVSST